MKRRAGTAVVVVLLAMLCFSLTCPWAVESPVKVAVTGGILTCLGAATWGLLRVEVSDRESEVIYGVLYLCLVLVAVAVYVLVLLH